jgi:hypothetical protein
MKTPPQKKLCRTQSRKRPHLSRKGFGVFGKAIKNISDSNLEGVNKLANLAFEHTQAPQKWELQI